MALQDDPISALTNYTAPISTDLLAIVDVTNGETKKITKNNFDGDLVKLDGSRPMTGPLTNNNADGSGIISGGLIQVYNTLANKLLAMVAGSTNYIRSLELSTGFSMYLNFPVGLSSTKTLTLPDESGTLVTQAYDTATGTDTYTSSLGLTSYVAGKIIYIKFTNANTGASTININTLGAKTIVKNGSTALSGGEINAGQIIGLIYDGTNYQIL